MRLRHFFNFALWLAALTAALAFLLHAASYGLSVPSLSANAWTAWLTSTEPATIVFSLARIGAIAAVGYLILSSALLGFATASRIKPLVVVATLIASPSVRRIVQGTVGISLAGVLVTPAIAGADTAPLPSDAPVLIHLAPGQQLPASTTTTTTLVLPPPVRTTSVSPPPQTAVVTQNSTHVVVAGENLWNIAKQSLTTDLGREPTGVELRTYWYSVVETNRARLLSHDNPDLIFPGQIIELPPTPPPPGA